VDHPVRTFCAIELPANIHQQIQKHVDRLRAAVPENHASWTRVENIHLTLKFFGNVEQNKTPLIANAATRAVLSCSPFTISIAGAGAFPKTSQARVLWIGVEDPSGKLGELQERFENECAMEGFEKEVRNFRPHLTIARLRNPKGARELAETHQSLTFKAVNLTVNELVIFRSELSSKGSRYTALSRHQLSDTL